MNLGKYLMAGLIMVGAGVGAETHSRPNFLFVIMDDFGGGQFPPVAQMLTGESFDPELVRYVADQKGFRVYESSQALEAARKAMPTMSRLTRDGLFFTQAFAGAALCAPSRCGIMSGIHPNRLGIYNNVDVTELPGAMTPGHFLAPRFQQAGYATGHIGKWHIGPLDDALAAPILKKHGLAPDTYVHSIPKASPAGRELVESGCFRSIIPSLHPTQTA
jgi:arylsulfatase A-like enzyme